MGLFDRTGRAEAPQPSVVDAEDIGGRLGVVTVRCAEGPTEQTLDQLRTCRARGIVDLTVILDRDGPGDGVDPEIVELIEVEMLDLLAKHGWTAEHVTVVSG